MHVTQNNVTTFQRLSRKFVQLIGWKALVDKPFPAKCVLVGAYHTTNWDFFALLALMATSGTKLYWVGKSSVFRGPFDKIFRALGGIPLNRNNSKGYVQQIAEVYAENRVMRIAISPEGTRRNTQYWRTGFYYMALSANVPIVLVYVDYKRKEIGIGPTIEPSGDINADLTIIADFFSNVTGKYPEKQGEIRLLEEPSDADTVQDSMVESTIEAADVKVERPTL